MTITTLDELKKIAGVPDSDGFDGFISLNGGARSSKQIWYDHSDDSWFILNGIDDSEVTYDTTDDLTTNESFLMQALNQGALHTY